MIAQFEITTRCNFDCFYCAGRHMRQADMDFETFRDLLDRHIERHGIPRTVSLQGEGEPTLHPRFFDMARYAREVGSEPYTITNGTCKHPQRFVGLFTQVGVSIDALEEDAARAIGRYNLPGVIRFVDALAPHLRVVIHSVGHQEYTPKIAAWCQQRGFAHVVQPLQPKADYSRHYPEALAAPPSTGRFSCGFIEQLRIRFYSLDGTVLPCCYIKDTTAFTSMAEMLNHQRAGTWPRCCIGCRYGVAREAQNPG